MKASIHPDCRGVQGMDGRSINMLGWTRGKSTAGFLPKTSGRLEMFLSQFATGSHAIWEQRKSHEG